MYKIGYTTGVFDLFHVGHLNILKRSKENCDFLIVGVSTDELTYELKGRFPVISFLQREEIIKSIRYVDQVVPEMNVDKLAAWKALHYNVLFKGSDAQQKEIYRKYENELKKVGVDVCYFPYTEGVSSTEIKEELIYRNKFSGKEVRCALKDSPLIAGRLHTD